MSMEVSERLLCVCRGRRDVCREGSCGSFWRELMGSNYIYQFTALRGLQAGRSFFTIMCPLKLVPRIFIFDEEELDPSLRAQRTINRTRVPEIARYIVNNPEEYVFSSITASINSSVEFEPVPANTGNFPSLSFTHSSITLSCSS